MKLTVIDLDYEVEMAETLAGFGKPIDDWTRKSLLGDGFYLPTALAMRCLRWIWHQWLSKSSGELIRKQVEPFVEKGLEMRKMCRSYYKLAQHDLLLLHCAIFASGDRQLKEVTEAIADASGDKGEKPINCRGQFEAACGELYAAAWCGLLKYSILGDEKKANEQASLIWGAYRDQELLAAPKPLVVPWLKKDWKAFVNQQHKDFEKFWNRARKHSWMVRSETPSEIVVRTNGCDVGNKWCWAHCGMALLAHRQGIEVATDPLWFPPHALKIAGAKR